MRFWESVHLAMGMEAKGQAPSHLVVDKITLDGGPIKIEWKGVSEIASDEVLVARLVHDLLIDKNIMFAPLEKERVEYVKLSLEDYQIKIDGYIARFIGATSSKDRFYASVLLCWKTGCKAALRELQEAEQTEQEDRAAYKRWELAEASDIMQAQDELPKVLSLFRRGSFPAADLFVDILPDNSLTKSQAKLVLAKIEAFLLNEYASNGQEFLKPTWSIDA